MTDLAGGNTSSVIIICNIQYITACACLFEQLESATRLRAETGIYDDVSKVERRAAAATRVWTRESFCSRPEDTSWASVSDFICLWLYCNGIFSFLVTYQVSWRLCKRVVWAVVSCFVLCRVNLTFRESKVSFAWVYICGSLSRFKRCDSGLKSFLNDSKHRVAVISHRMESSLPTRHLFT